MPIYYVHDTKFWYDIKSADFVFVFSTIVEVLCECTSNLRLPTSNQTHNRMRSSDLYASWRKKPATEFLEQLDWTASSMAL
jgi:hypothetical protein